MIRSLLFLLLPALAGAGLNAQAPERAPSIEEVLSLRSPGNVAISPDGRHVAYTVGTTDWENNRYDREIWLSKDGGQPFQLTRTADGSSGGPVWSPDGQWIAFTAKRGEHTQIHLIRVDGGEAFPVTSVERSIGDFGWAPDSRRIAFTMEEPKPATAEARKNRYGAYAVEDEEYRRQWLYLIEVDPARASSPELPCYDEKDAAAQAWPCPALSEAEVLIDSVNFTISDFFWSPDGRRIAVQHQPDPLINSWPGSDISLLDVATKTLTPFLNSDYPERLAGWSPDSRRILYQRSKDDTTAAYYLNPLYFAKPVDGGKAVPLATDFEEELYGWKWTGAGLFAMANVRTERHLYRIDPASGAVTRWPAPQSQVGSFSLTPDGDRIAYSAANGDDLSEVYLSPVSTTPQPERLTGFSTQIEGWRVAGSEVISWRSRDGVAIEGVLHKPWNYEAGRKYPLLVVIHGGPTGVDRPAPVLRYVYPVVQWLNKGALVLRVNYRGSAGYGEDFRSLNVRNLGVGDAWDVLSGVDHLDDLGLIDTSRMGCMGWSQGG